MSIKRIAVAVLAGSMLAAIPVAAGAVSADGDVSLQQATDKDDNKSASKPSNTYNMLGGKYQGTILSIDDNLQRTSTGTININIQSFGNIDEVEKTTTVGTPTPAPKEPTAINDDLGSNKDGRGTTAGIESPKPAVEPGKKNSGSGIGTLDDTGNKTEKTTTVETPDPRPEPEVSITTTDDLGVDEGKRDTTTDTESPSSVEEPRKKEGSPSTDIPGGKTSVETGKTTAGSSTSVTTTTPNATTQNENHNSPFRENSSPNTTVVFPDFGFELPEFIKNFFGDIWKSSSDSHHSASGRVAEDIDKTSGATKGEERNSDRQQEKNSVNSSAGYTIFTPVKSQPPVATSLSHGGPDQAWLEEDTVGPWLSTGGVSSISFFDKVKAVLF